jgi:predicted histidine transporter YuiF (NhaC family)
MVDVGLMRFRSLRVSYLHAVSRATECSHHLVVLAGLFAISVLLAVGAYLGPAWGIGTSVATMVVAAAIFVSASIVISVDARQIQVGRAIIEHAYIAASRALDADQTVGGLVSRPMSELIWCFVLISRRRSRSP